MSFIMPQLRLEEKINNLLHSGFEIRFAYIPEEMYIKVALIKEQRIAQGFLDEFEIIGSKLTELPLLYLITTLEEKFNNGI